MAPERQDPSVPGGRGRFLTTHWTMVIAAGRGDGDERRRAMGELCTRYWYPVYAFLRRRGCDADEAMDVTQGFFARLLEKGDLEAVDPVHGRFRSWVLASVKHYLSNEREKARAAKRGGGATPLSIDAADAENRYRLEPSHQMTPERVFERRWALTLLEQTLAALRAECRADGKEPLFEALKGYLAGRSEDGTYGKVADELGMSEGAVRMAAHRLRRRYREILREQIAQTVETPEQVDEEIQFLFTVVG